MQERLKRLIDWLFGGVLKPQDSGRSPQEPLACGPSKPTHIIITFNSQHTELMFRATSGLAMAQWKDTTLIWGVDVQHRESRVFMNAECAARYMREVVAPDDLKAQGIAGAPVFEVRDGEPLIHLPDGTMGLADPLPRRMKAKMN